MPIMGLEFQGITKNHDPPGRHPSFIKGFPGVPQPKEPGSNDATKPQRNETKWYSGIRSMLNSTDNIPPYSGICSASRPLQHCITSIKCIPHTPKTKKRVMGKRNETQKNAPTRIRTEDLIITVHTSDALYQLSHRSWLVDVRLCYCEIQQVCNVLNHLVRRTATPEYARKSMAY